MALDIIDEPVAVLAHSEEIIAFLDRGDLSSAIRTLAFDEIFFSKKSFASDAIPSGIFGAVDFSAVVEILQNLADYLFVEIKGGTDEEIVGNAEAFPEFLETDNCFIAMSEGFDVAFLGGFFNFLSVFIGTGQKEGIEAEGSLIAAEDVSEDGGVGVADMGFIVYVINGGGDVKIFVHVETPVEIISIKL